ncbi:stage III sporulation protein SpoAB [Clostridium tarantellae]|uniref:Stage III sporulation protein SpoAB n=1 Tax=Clostridium tarantellae TaxID=39493 RepID=A0A6I1MHA7_9CLOT|nr:stage III sporulation protein SpoAB [Clostridium tarantellae]
MRFFLLMLIVMLCSLIGYSYGEQFNNRYIQLQELMRALIDLQNEIIFAHTPLPNALNKIGEKCKEPIKILLKDISEKLSKNEVSNVYIAFKCSINDHKKNLNLKNEDYDVFLDLSKSLGETNVDGQSKLFSLAKEKLNSLLKIAEKECNSNRKVYRYLGVSVGAMISIFLM